jgi:hypothetical protein
VVVGVTLETQLAVLVVLVVVVEVKIQQTPQANLTEPIIQVAVVEEEAA